MRKNTCGIFYCVSNRRWIFEQAHNLFTLKRSQEIRIELNLFFLISSMLAAIFLTTQKETFKCTECDRAKTLRGWHALGNWHTNERSRSRIDGLNRSKRCNIECISNCAEWRRCCCCCEWCYGGQNTRSIDSISMLVGRHCAAAMAKTHCECVMNCNEVSRRNFKLQTDEISEHLFVAQHKTLCASFYHYERRLFFFFDFIFTSFYFRSLSSLV